MDIQTKIDQYFKHPNLRVLFFFDALGQYQEQLEQLNLPDIRVVKWANNNFGLKTKLYGDWKNDKILLYFMQAAPSTPAEYQAFPLLGLLVANKQLSLDDVGEFMNDFGLARHQKPLITKYMHELQHKTTKDVCAPILSSGNFTEEALIKGLLSAFLGFKQPEDWALLIGKLLIMATASDTKEWAKLAKKVADNGLFDTLQQHIAHATGIRMQHFETDQLLRALQSVLYNSITKLLPTTLPADPYRGFKIVEPKYGLQYAPGILRLNQFLHDIERSKTLYSKFKEALEHVSADIRGEELVRIYGTDAPFAHYTKAMVWEIIRQIQQNIAIKPLLTIEAFEGILAQKDLPKAVSNTLHYLIHTAQMYEGINAIKTYILNTPDQYVLHYTQQWHLIDTYYRRAIKLFKGLDITQIPSQIALDDSYTALNNAYEQHTDKLNREWLKCLASINFEYQKMATPKQYHFYQKHIAPIDQKVVVIISDALRYEAAYELLDTLHTDPNNTAQIGYQLASIPSVTSVGMAQLLPGKERQFNNGLILLDGISTEGIDNRGKILAKAKLKALAVQYSDIQGKSQADNRELFKNQVVYLYHNTIDAIGDKQTTQYKTFNAVDDAIKELAEIIKKIHSTYNVAKVIVTADHGFLYNDRDLPEQYKETTPNPDALITRNRVAVSNKNTLSDMAYQFPLSATTLFNEALWVTTPKSVNRYKKQGVGHQFVHGGGSLQELVVPLIESSRKEKAVTQKVNPVLITSGNLLIVSNILRLTILQEKKVSRFEKERTINIALYKDQQLASNKVQLTLNSTSELPTERTKRIELILASSAATESFLKLKVFDDADKLNPLIEEIVQNNTLIQSDF